MHTVWVVSNKNIDPTPAAEFGRLKPVFPGQVDPFKLDLLYEEALEKLREISDQDYVLLSGRPELNVIVSNIFIQRFGQVRFLIFDAKSRTYVYKLFIPEVYDAA